MARKHSKLTVILINGTDISEFCTDSNCERSKKTEDVTTYGKDDEVYDSTLRSGAFGCSGKYGSGVTGPRAVLLPLVEADGVVTVTYRPEGTGSGLPQNVFDAVLTKYAETAPVAGYRLWSLETQPSDEWDNTAQS